MQTGAMRRCKRYMSDTDEFICNNNEGFLADPLTTSGGYCKMVSLCNNLSCEIETDIKIHGQHVLPRYAGYEAVYKVSSFLVLITSEMHIWSIPVV
jgi:hypothetical protein